MRKITRPILTGILPRKRLFRLLDDLRRKPVLWISGPPGCGKTTLISTYIDARKLPCLWYQIDEGDSDIASFFYYMGQAAQKCSPRKRMHLPLLTPEYMQGISTFTRRYFEKLCNQLRTPSVLVFDNFHDVSGSLLDNVIANGLSSLQEGITVVLISRSEPSPALVQLRANNLMGIVGWNEIRLTVQESSAIVRLRSGQKVAKKTLQRLHDASGGWAAGLVLLQESAQRGVESHEPGKLAPEEIFPYFGTVLFDKADNEVQHFLLKTALLPSMTADTAQKLTGLSHASRLLSALNGNNYFLEKRIGKEISYQYHPLFRDFLLARARETYPLSELSAVRRTAALLLEDAGEVEAAAALFREDGQWDRLVRLILNHASLMLAQGRNQTLVEWINTIPKQIFQKQPWLLYWMGASHLLFQPSLSGGYFEDAFEQFRTQEHTDGIFLSWSGIIESIICKLDDFKPLDQWIAVLEELMKGMGGPPSKSVWAQVTSAAFLALQLRQPQHPDIEEWERRALEALEDHVSISYKTLTLGRLALYRMQRGDLEKGLFLTDALTRLARSEDSPKALLLSKYLDSLYYAYTGEHERCLEAISEGLRLSGNSGLHVFDPMLLSSGVLSALSRNDLKVAGELLDRMSSSASTSGRLNAQLYHFLRTSEALARDDLRQASLHADLTFDASEGLGMPQAFFSSQLIRACLLRRAGKDQEAGEHLAHALEIACRIGYKTFEYYGLWTEALFAYGQNREEMAMAALGKALAVARDGGYFCTSVGRPQETAELCVKALEAGIQIEHVQELVRRLNVTPVDAPIDVQNWPWPLKIFTLGRFGLLKDGKPMRSSGKVQKRPLSMLKTLIALGGKEVREDRIADILWAESDGDAAHMSFLTTLHRLRELLGHEKAIRYKEGRLTLDERCCWVDAWAFEHALAQAEARWKKGLTDGALALTERGLELYKGPFLAAEIAEPWSISMRERLKGKYLRSLSQAALHWERREAWERAAELYEKALETNDLVEELYQQLMNCYQRSGKKAEALAVYERCRKTLSAVLGIKLSAKTETIYRALLSNPSVL